MHDYARKAAIAALAAGKQGKFWEVHEKLFANQNDLSDAKVEAIAGELGLDMEQFNKDLKDPAIASLIDRDMNDGRAGKCSRDAYHFRKRKVAQSAKLQGFQQAIEAELKKKK